MRIAYIALFSLCLGQPEQAQLRDDTDEKPWTEIIASYREKANSVLPAVDLDLRFVATINVALDKWIAATHAVPSPTVPSPAAQQSPFTPSSPLQHNVSAAMKSLERVDYCIAAIRPHFIKRLVEVQHNLTSMVDDRGDLGDQLRKVSLLYTDMVEDSLPFIRDFELYQGFGSCFMFLDALLTKWNVDTQHLRSAVRELEHIAPLGFSDILDPASQASLLRQITGDLSEQNNLVSMCSTLVERQTEGLVEGLASFACNLIVEFVGSQAEAYFYALKHRGRKPAGEVVDLLMRVIELANKHNVNVRILRLQRSVQRLKDLSSNRSGESAV